MAVYCPIKTCGQVVSVADVSVDLVSSLVILRKIVCEEIFYMSHSVYSVRQTWKKMFQVLD